MEIDIDGSLVCILLLHVYSYPIFNEPNIK